MFHTSVKRPPCDSFLRVSFKPIASKNEIVAVKSIDRNIVCRKTTSPSLGNELYVSEGRKARVSREWVEASSRRAVVSKEQQKGALWSRVSVCIKQQSSAAGWSYIDTRKVQRR
jgi:hypothetical protein